MRIAAAIAAMAAFVGASQADGLHGQLASLVARGENIYAEAEKVVIAHPTTQSDVNDIATTVGKTFSQDENAYQISFLPVINAHVGRLPADLDDGFVRVWTFDIFVAQAVAATYDCHDALARYDLMIARQMLDHARLASEGHPNREWAPGSDVPNDSAKCK
jgi:hypothetical protein